MNNTNFEAFVNLLNQGSLKIHDGELIIELQEPLNKGSLYEEMLKSIGYKFDNVRTVRKNKIYISFNASHWDKQCLLFENWEKLFLKVKDSQLPEHFFIIETKESSLKEPENKLRLKLFSKVRKLLANLADQCDPYQGITKGANKLSFIIETEAGVVKYQFKPELDWNDLKLIPIDENQISTTENLIKRIAIGDSQDSERRSVMRSAFHEIISVCNIEKDIFKKVISSIINFNKRYEEHHDLFVKRFSINKVLHEINEQDLTYTSKINEILSNAQNKTLTIPAALIAISAVMKIDRLVDGVVVILGMLITTIIVYRSLNVYQKTFIHICKQVKFEFERYNVLSQDVEIRKKAEETKKELEILLRDAFRNSTFMKQTIWLMFIISFIFITIVTPPFLEDKNTLPTENSDINKELILKSVFDLRYEIDNIKARLLPIENKKTKNTPYSNIKSGFKYKTIQNLNLRSGPGVNHSLISILPIDSIASMIKVQDNWWKIKTETGSVGWVSSLWLRSIDNP